MVALTGAAPATTLTQAAIVLVQGAERAVARVLQVDDVGAGPSASSASAAIAHAGKEEGHGWTRVLIAGIDRAIQ